MMIALYNKQDLEKYLQDDTLLELLKQYSQYEQISSHKWLVDMPAKRMIFNDLYGDLLKTHGKKVLDVGGGFSGLTLELIERHDYQLVETLDHGDSELISNLFNKNKGELFLDDWYKFKPVQQYDYIIANDLFPNVDQRLHLFIEKFRPHAKRLLVTLTCYDGNRYHMAKRVDADEVLTIAA